MTRDQRNENESLYGHKEYSRKELKSQSRHDQKKWRRMYKKREDR